MNHIDLAQLCLQAYDPAGIPDALDFGHRDHHGPRAFVLNREGGTIVVFRGTADVQGWLADLDAARYFWMGGHVHYGFYCYWRDLRESILGAIGINRVFITGHSLGGALALLMAREIAWQTRECVTFGKPRVGDKAFRDAMPKLQMTRYVNLFDPVPWVPGAFFDWRHVAPARWYDGEQWGDFSIARWAKLVWPALVTGYLGHKLALLSEAEKIASCHGMEHYIKAMGGQKATVPL